MKPVNKAADRIAFSHNYTIHTKNLHDKMLCIVLKERIFKSQTKQLNSRHQSWEEDLPTYFKALVGGCETMQDQVYGQDLVQQEHPHSSTR